MPRPLGLSARRAGARRAGRRNRATASALVVLSGVTVATLAAAATSFLRESVGPPQEFRPAAAVVLGFCGLWQLLTLRRVIARKHRLKALTLGLRSPFWQWLIVLLAGSYVLALLIGPGIRAQHAFAALAVASYTMVLARFTRKAKEPQLAALRVKRPKISLLQWGAWGICGLILTVCAAELALRTIDAISDRPTHVVNYIRAATLPPGVEYHGRTANQLGYWDEEFVLASNPNARRVVVLGDELTLAGNAESNFVSQLEAELSGTEVLHFGVTGASPREYGVVLAADAARFQPDVVLVFVNLANDVSQRPELPGLFDWRGLRLYEWRPDAWPFNQLPRHEGAIAAKSTMPGTGSRPTYESLLAQAERDAAVCRAPINRPMRDNWQTVFDSLGGIQQLGDNIGAEVVIVLTPSRVQVDHALQTAVQRRLGIGRENLQADLPQRRMTEFAEQHAVTIIDMTTVFHQLAAAAFDQNSTTWTTDTHRQVAEFLAPVIEQRLNGSRSEMARR